MRNNGWSKAKLTKGGSDGGIDVQAPNAVAQVKWFASQKVGRPAIQQLSGSAGTKKALFFANSAAGSGEPYSKPALDWASENNVRLLAITKSGSVISL